jgi:DNA (cytosine-5)-methyltransferase 1
MRLLSPPMKVFDLFCGTGGFSKGFENSHNAVYKVVFGVDILPMSIETFKLNHPFAFGLRQDIREIPLADLQSKLRIKKGELGLVIGGPPCQGFSSIRPFRSSNEDDPRNTLFEQFANFVNFFRPKALVLENVIGLATHKGGETISKMQECFASIGYDCDWKILNAANFGVPQRRERMVFMGVERGGKIVFPEPSHFSNGSTIGYRNKQKMLLPQDDLFTPYKELRQCVTVMNAIADLPRIHSGGQATVYDCNPQNDYQSERRKNCKNLTLHYSTAHTPKMLEIIKHSGKNISCIPPHLITSGFSSCYSRLDGDTPSVTITVNFVHPASNRCIHPVCDRALTPREGARLQSFDDDFQFAGNRSQVVKQIGNAVPPLLGKAIGETLARIL